MIVYGKGVSAIAEDLHVDIEKAQQIKDAILGSFPQLKQYLEDVVDFCKEYGFVYDFFGRKRRLPDIRLPEYEFEINSEDEKTKEYYSGIYRGKLSKCRSLREKNSIISEAESKGITIKQNGGFIAQAVRNAYNSPVQCVSGYTFITTKEHGLSKISDCAGEDITVWDGDNFVNATCMYTGKKKLYIVEFDNRKILKCSGNHKLLTDTDEFITVEKLHEDVVVQSSNLDTKLKETTRIKNIIATDYYIDMYDIVNSESHKFVANGIITHNCTAANITKKAIINIGTNKRLQELGARLVLTIHDENIISVPRENAYEASKIMEKCSIDAGVGLKAKLRCDVSIEDSWSGTSLVFDENVSAHS